VIKSGGEWISSVDLENKIMSHPKVLEACVVGIPHPQWSERPLAFVVANTDVAGQLTKEEIIEYLTPRVAKWWLPNEVIFVDAIPKTSVGKFDKKVLRNQYGT
jgi:fatty-acyl-CoA synthase